MKNQWRGVLATIVFGGLICLFLLVAKSNSQIAESEHWGSVSNGLQMSISIAKHEKKEEPIFQVTFRNAGERDVTLNLGMMLANGKVQLPTKIRLVLTDAAGKKRELHSSEPSVRGRIDDYIVPLRAGSTYMLKLDLDQFWSPTTKEFELKLNSGTYQVFAQLEGSGAEFINHDTQGIGLMNFWKGEVQSNVLPFER